MKATVMDGLDPAISGALPDPRFKPEDDDGKVSAL